MSILIFDLLAGSVFLACLYLYLIKRSSGPPLPPGPPADPLIGHLRVMPTENVPGKFYEWSKIYGDVMHLKVLNRDIIILGSVDAAKALLERKGRNYHCRPKFTVLEMMGWTPFMSFMQYGTRYLKHRKMVEKYLGMKESLAFNDIFEEETKTLVRNLINARHGDHFRFTQQFTLSNIMGAAFGHRVKSIDDPFVRLAEGATDALNNCGPVGNTPVDLFPWLQYLPTWFPGTYYTSVARSYRGVVRELYDAILDAAKNKQCVDSRSFATDKLEELGADPDVEDVEDVRSAAVTMFAGGEDTTFASLITFFLTSIIHPEVQQRAYKEIVTVVGENRLPQIQDRSSLPYVECVVQEVLRWHSILALAPHRAIEDDIFNGMFIPANAMVVANIGGMSKDERVYSNPDSFDPIRYLPQPIGRAEPKFSAVWGFGRRICPGRHFADLALWNAISCIVATLELLPVEGQEYKAEFTEGLISQPRPFRFKTQLRSMKAGELLAQVE